MDQGDEPPFPAAPPAEPEELSEEAQDKQNGLKQQAADLLEDGKQEEALEKLNEAIAVGCASAMLIVRRAQLLSDLGRPRATINDCSAALAVNPNSAKAFKIRGKSYAKLEMLEEAHSDFQTGLKIDYDLMEDVEDLSKEVAAKVKDMQASKVKERNKAEEEEYHRQMQENKRKYEEGLKANEEKFREERMKEEEEKRKKEEERKERVRKREEETKGEGDGYAADGAPKSHAPPEPGTAEDVD